MTGIAIFWAALWGVVANILAALPSRDNHWFRAYVLIATGLPILIWVWWQNGLIMAMVVLVAGASMLRWPVRYLGRWLLRQMPRG